MSRRHPQYKQIRKTLTAGVAMERAEMRPGTPPASIPVNKLQQVSAIAYRGAKRSKQLSGLGEGEMGLVDFLNRAGAQIPDSLMGVSTKTILAGALLISLLRK